jgi:hypothetical protein
VWPRAVSSTARPWKDHWKFVSPNLERVFDREFLGRKWKHVIEPRATYRYVTGVDNFASILRFDERDILSNTNEVEYTIVNRFYAKRTSEQPEDCGAEGMNSLIVGRPAIASRIPWERAAGARHGPLPGRFGRPRGYHLGAGPEVFFLIKLSAGLWSPASGMSSPRPWISPAFRSLPMPAASRR